MFGFHKKKPWYQRVFTYINVVSDIKILILMIATVMIWRGIWDLVDRYLLPSHPMISALASIIIGVIILFLNDNSLSRLDSGAWDEE